MRRVFIAVLIGAALAASSAANAQGSPFGAPKESINRGRDVARRNCATCHATGERGDSPNAMAPAFRHLGRRYGWDNLEAALAAGMLIHHPAMPEIHLSPSETDDLISYLKSIQSQGDETRPAPNQPFVQR